jgi:cysteine-rich repeat protein
MFWKIAAVLVPLMYLLAAGGCSDLENPAECPSGLICPPGTMCAAKQDICISDSCGNGIIDGRAGEVCDDGNIIAGDGCSQDCKSNEECGNGVIDKEIGEICDDSNQISGDGCSADCTSSEECGDGFVNELDGEQCDDGGNSANCDFDCTRVACGDGLVNAVAGEQCDPPSQTCSTSCLRINCGDRIKDSGEDCDEGGVNTETCDADCTLPACGDGVHNARAGEPCDEGGQDTASCNGNCTFPRCGDGWWNPVVNEQCDTAGNSSACDQDCTWAQCGDRFINPAAGEECDDGNPTNTDECTAVCEPANCTDGFQNADEIDVDCGGHCGSHSCAMLQACLTNEDCTAGVCLGGTCVPDASRLATGDGHTCTLLNTNAVRCWGGGDEGQLGYGNRNNIGDDESPASAGDVDIGGPVIQIAVGARHSCALLDTGAVRCWGDGYYGQLGYGNRNNIGDDESPASAGDVDIGGPVIQIAAGAFHTCALQDTGVVRCWGDGNFGQLGYGNQDSIGGNQSPATAGDINVGGSTIQIAAGNRHTCALLDTGAVRCWGDGSYGQLGYGNQVSIGDDELPATAGDVNVGGSAIQIAAGGRHTCALLDTGAVRCWGDGDRGQLGYGDTKNIGDNEAPASAGNINVGVPVVQIAASSGHTCALLKSSAVRCWGFGWPGQLGYGNTNDIGDDETPSTAGNVNVGGAVAQIDVGTQYTCALLVTGAVRCWGSGYEGRLGYGNTNDIGDNESPAAAGNVNVGDTITQIAAGNAHTCALLDTGAVRCWGSGYEGRLGYGNTNHIGDNESPAAAGNVDVGGAVIQIAAGGAHTCALLDTGVVRCWGHGYLGQLGYGNPYDIGDDESPVAAGNVDVGGAVIQIAAGVYHTCALLDTGAVRCWGYGYHGQLGYRTANNVGDDESPGTAGDVDVGGAVIQIATGVYHTCALLDTGAVRCWGQGAYGQLGYGNTINIGDDESPATAGDVDVGGTAIQIAAGGFHTCALLDTGAARCWGVGARGRLGYGNTSDIGDDESPALAGDVDVGGSIIQIAANHRHTCALLGTGAVRCWGFGDAGRLGYGNMSDVGDDESPALAGNVNVGGIVIQIAAGALHSCALLDNAAVRCWGEGGDGQLGYGNTNDIGDDESPAAAGDVSLGGAIHQNATSFEYMGALLGADPAACQSDEFSGPFG